MNFDNDFSATTGAAREKVQQAITTARDRAGDALAHGGQCVRDRPAASLLAVFGVGIAVGIVVASALRPAPRRKSALADSLGDSRERLAELFGTVAANLRTPLKKTCASVSDRASTIGGSVAEALDKVRRGRIPRWW